MSETFARTRESLRRLRDVLREADEDTQFEFAFWITSLVLMGGAIVAQFGWNGVIFCTGILFLVASEGGKKS